MGEGVISGLRLHRLLNRSLDLHEELLDGLPLGITVLSEDGRVVLFNRWQEQISGRRREDVLGKVFFESVATSAAARDLRERYDAALPPDSMASSVAHTFECPNRPTALHAIVYFHPLTFKDRSMVAIVTEDVTERTVLQQERDRLLRAMFHDLRSPLSGIGAYAELLATGDQDPAVLTEALSQIAASCGDMLELLDASTTQLRGDDRNGEVLDLAFVTHGLALESALVCRADGLQIAVNGEPLEMHNLEYLAPVQIFAARADACRAVRNLLSNAAKYASSRIDLSVYVDEGRAVLIVEDDGVGIPSGYEDKILEGGVQAPDAKPGTGLGLEIVARWVGTMGGAVRADRSELGGARFRVELPLRA